MVWINKNSTALRFAGCLLFALVWSGAIGGSLTSCTPDDAPIPPVAGKPLPQDGRIPIEVSAGGELKTVHASRHAMENFAAKWCLAERATRTDNKMCGGDSASDIVQRSIAALAVTDEPGVTALVMGAPDKCGETLCFERNEVCAGYLLEEIGKSASAREFDIAQIEVLGTSVTIGDLELTENEIAAVGIGGSGDKLKVLRTQPLGAAGRGAVFRGSLNRFRRATGITEELRSREWLDSGTMQPTTCALELKGRDDNGYPTGLNTGADGFKPKWSDVFLETFIDAATEYTVVLPATVTSMREAAEFEVRGRATDVDEVETQWNGAYDSATAVAKLMAYGDVAAPPQATWTGPPGGTHFLGITQGPTGAPTCPPAKPSGNNVISQAKAMKVSPTVLTKYPQFSTMKFDELLVAAYNEDQWRLGLISNPLTKNDVLKRLAISQDDLDRGKAYLEKEISVFNLVEVFEQSAPLPSPPSGFVHVPRVISANKPNQGTVLQAPAISSQFLGSVAPSPDVNLSSPNYSQHGAIMAVDKMKQTAMAIFKPPPSDPPGPISVAAPVMKEALLAFDQQAEIYVGSRRVEFLFGTQTGPDVIDKVKVRVHGVPVAGGKLKDERYAIVQGLDALKCVTTGTIDAVACKVSDYLLELGDTVGPLDAQMFDLSGGTFEQEFSTVVRPGNSSTPIAVPDQIYLLRQEKQGLWKAFAGALSAQGSASITGGFTRRVFMPAGGNYDDIVASALLPDPDDCSKPLLSCAGLPTNLFPPLESEVNGEQTSLPYERSWRKYLDEAKDAADQADRLGTEVVQAGLAMDQRREVAIAELRDLCGAEANEDGCGIGAKDLRTVALGDLSLCLWQSKGQMCKCTGGDCTGALKTCPLQLPPGVTADENTCKTFVEGLNGGPAPVDKYVPVPDVLNLVHSAQVPINKDAGGQACAAFTYLRKTEQNGGPTREQRKQVIRKDLMPYFGRTVLGDIAKGMRYTELFGDHYELSQNGGVIFTTRRPGPQALNSKSSAPCIVDTVGATTGSDFWNRQVQCYVSGTNQGGATCPPQNGSGIGWDGCDPLTTSINGDYSKLSLDTEKDALRNRWRWGFGHLRRSVVGLGMMTGELNGMLLLGRIGAPARALDRQADPDLASWTRVGTDLAAATTGDREPAWVFHASPYGQTDLRTGVRCVALGGQLGVGLDVHRNFSGRPANYTAWLPNRVPVDDENQNVFAVGGASVQSHVMLQGFPCYDEDGPQSGTCVATGADPQMPYCFIPPEAQWSPSAANQFDLFSSIGGTFQTYSGPYINGSTGISNGYIGTTVPEIATVGIGAPWGVALQDMWTDPGDDLCPSEDLATKRGAVWQAFCSPPGPDPNDQDPNFIHRGQAQSGPPVYFSRFDMAPWLTVKADSHAAYLYNLNNDNLTEFQYQLDRRTIYDATELACHAAARPVTKAVDCDAALGGNVQSIEQYAALVDCYGNRVAYSLGAFTLDGIPKPVVDGVALKGGLIAPGPGVGGALLDEMVAQSRAIRNISTDYQRVRTTYRNLALLAVKLSLADQSIGLQQKLSDQQALIVTLDSLAGIANALGAAAGSAVASGGSASVFYLSSAVAQATALWAKLRALETSQALAQNKAQQDRLDVLVELSKEAVAARDAASDLIQQVNALAAASSHVQLIISKASVAVSKANFADNAGDKGNDPQFVNIVMRRTYNTALIRYQTALDRAKKAAFLARRAIELRFGVDLAKMSSPMKLVDAPSSWANRICTMQGIDYSKIRTPDPDASVNGFKFGAPPLVGDDYANAFIGDYVRLLEDFVKSYPIDFPLKDGDDTAVLSLRDDLLSAKRDCVAPGRNSLYYARALGSREGTTPTATTRGWFVRGCGAGAPELPGSTWNGCVGAYASSPAATAPDGNGDQGATFDGVALAGLPEGAVAYRINSQPCVPSSTTTCPAQTTNTAFGAVAQIIAGLTSANYVASVYVHKDTPTYSSGNTAVLRVVRRTDETVVGSTPFAPTGGNWDRVLVAFPADPDTSYRLEILPSAQTAAISGPNQISVLVAAAQIEQVKTLTDPPTPWVSTDLRRDVIDPVCEDATGTELRKRFERKCSFVCSNGLQDKCPATDPKAVPKACYYEANFAIPLEQIESGQLIPSGQIAIGNFNFRHNEIGLNVTGTGVTNCDGIPQNSCYDNGFIQYTLIHSGDVSIRNWTGASLVAHMDTAFIEHGKALAAERVVTNPPSGNDLGLMSPYMKGEYKGRPLEGLYTLRIYDSPSLRWERVRDIQLVTKYHYWTRFSK